jgi:iron complex outermembrane receptor protein
VDHRTLGSTRSEGAFFRTLLGAAIILCVCFDASRLRAAEALGDVDTESGFAAALTVDETDSESQTQGLYEATVVESHAAATDRSTAFAETIDLSQKSSQVSSVTDVLAGSTGVQVRRLGGLGSLATASIRGSTSSQVLVFLDGVPLNTGGFSAVNLGDLSLDSLASMEIYRGVTPLELGLGGMGGAVVLRTRLLDEPLTEMAASVGSWSTTRLLALRGDRVGPLFGLVVLGTSHTEGDFEYLNRNGTAYNEDDDRLQPRSNNDNRDIGALVKVGAQLGEFRLTVLNDLLAKRQGIAGLDSVPTQNTSLRTFRELLGLSLEQPEDGRRFRLSFGASYLLLSEDFDDTDGEIGVGNQRTISRSDTVGGHGIAGLRWTSTQKTELLLSAYYDRYREKELIQDSHPEPSSRSRVLAGLQHESKLMGRLDVVPTVRAQWHRIYWPGAPQSGALTRSETRKGDRFYVSPSLGLRAEAMPWLWLRANVGRYLRPPDLPELYGNSGSVVGNAELRPEVGLNADAGFTVETDTVPGIDSVRLEAAWFGAWVEDLITYTQNSQHTLRLENVDDARIQGAEAAIRLAVWHTLVLSGNYTYTHGINRSAKPYHNGKVLPGRPQHEALLRLEAARDFINFGSGAWVELDYAGKSFLDQANLKEDTLGRALLNLGLRFKLLRQGLTFTVEARNLLDTIVLTDDQNRARPLRDYEAYPLPGRTFYATAHWKI